MVSEGLRVRDVVMDLELRRDAFGDLWFDTGTIIMKTDDVIAKLRTVDQDLRVLDYKISADHNNPVSFPWLFIHVEGRKDEGS